MNERHNDATHNRPEGDRILDAALVTIDLADNIRQIKGEEAWYKNDRNAITVYKTDALSMVLVALHANAEIKPPLASEGITVLQVIEGFLKFTTEMQTVELKKGQLLTLHKNIIYTALALEETIILLTVTTNKNNI